MKCLKDGSFSAKSFSEQDTAIVSVICAGWRHSANEHDADSYIANEYGSDNSILMVQKIMFCIKYYLGKYKIFLRTVCFIILAGGTVYGQDLSLFDEVDEGVLDGVERSTWRFEYVNDSFFNKDNKISSGWALQKHSAVAGSWEALQGVPGFVKRWGKKIPTLTEEGLVYRAGIAIGQIIQTPGDLSRSDLIEDDVPYAGALTLQTTWYAFNDEEFRGFESIVGVVGPPSLAEETQTTYHDLTDNEEPKGWDNQLSTEPVINFNYMRKQKIWRWGNPKDFSFDSAINGNVGLGNLFTLASAGLEMRFGYNMPRGFAYVPDPIGFSIHYIASLKPLNPHAPSIYATVVLRGTAIAYNIFLDGNTFSDSHSVEKEPLVGLTVVGLHYEIHGASTSM